MGYVRVMTKKVQKVDKSTNFMDYLKEQICVNILHESLENFYGIQFLFVGYK